jgi:hypothetical protein
MWTPCVNPSQPPPSSSVPRRAELVPCVRPRRPGPPPPSGNRSRSGQGRGRRRATLASQLRPAWGEVGTAATSRKLSPSSLTATWSDGDLERLRAQPLSVQQRCAACDEDGRGWPSLASARAAIPASGRPGRELRWSDEGRGRTGRGRPGTAFWATRRGHAGMARRCCRTAASIHGRRRPTAQRPRQGLWLKRRPRKREGTKAARAAGSASCRCP